MDTIKNTLYKETDLVNITVHTLVVAIKPTTVGKLQFAIAMIYSILTIVIGFIFNLIRIVICVNSSLYLPFCQLQI